MSGTDEVREMHVLLHLASEPLSFIIARVGGVCFLGVSFLGFGVGDGIVGGVDHAATINIKCQLDINHLYAKLCPIDALGNF